MNASNKQLPDLRERLTKGEPCLGAWLTVASPMVAEAMASQGFHWLALDMEHGPFGEMEAQTIFVVAERHGCVPIVRLPGPDPYLARRLLDCGARGIILPVTQSAASFSDFARHCLYPPDGRRGVGLSRANLWGATFDDYFRGFRPLLIPQVETRAGIEAAEALAALPFVDALFIGPYDLSADLGIAGNFDSPLFTEALAKMRGACSRHAKAAGIHQVDPDPVRLQERLADGYRLIAYGTDILAIRTTFSRIGLTPGLQ